MLRAVLWGRTDCSKETETVWKRSRFGTEAAKPTLLMGAMNPTLLMGAMNPTLLWILQAVTGQA